MELRSYGENKGIVKSHIIYTNKYYINGDINMISITLEYTREYREIFL